MIAFNKMKETHPEHYFKQIGFFFQSILLKQIAGWDELRGTIVVIQ